MRDDLIIDSKTEDTNTDREIGCLYLKTGAKGKFYSGYLVTVDGEKQRIVVFPNRRKTAAIQEGNPKAENWPDLHIYKSLPPQKQSKPEAAKESKESDSSVEL